MPENKERRARLEGEGFTVLSLEKKEDEGLRAKNLVFCAPPTGELCNLLKLYLVHCTSNTSEKCNTQTYNLHKTVVL